MLILLPPSETKRDGGVTGSQLDVGALSFPSLLPARRSALAGLRALSKSVTLSTKALGLGPKQRFEIDRNRAISTSSTMPAIERYTGVLYDAIDVGTLDGPEREFVGNHVLVHSALFGLIGANDAIPAYRFSHDTRVAGSSLARIWRDANAAVLADAVIGDSSPLVLDLRSESYVHLGPASAGSWFVRVVSDDGSGRRRALNHFNKHGKGEFVRALAQSGLEFASVTDLLDWASSAGIRLVPGAEGELDLIV